MNADLIQLILAEHARVEDGNLANSAYLAVKIADTADERLNVAKEALLEIARVFRGWAPGNIASHTLARMEGPSRPDQGERT